MSQIRAVIFDCYGTLLDIRTDENKDRIFHCLSLYLQYYGGTIDAEKLKSAYELEKERLLQASAERYPEIDLEQVFQNILTKEGLTNPFLAESCCKLQRLLSRERFQLFPDSLPVLREMKSEGFPLGLVSDAQQVFYWEEGRMVGIEQFFDYMIVSSELGFKKPDPRLFAIACTLLNVPPREAVYIGDSAKRDIPGPKQIGMRVILVNRGQEGEKLEAEPDFVAKDLWDAWAWVRGDGKA